MNSTDNDFILNFIAIQFERIIDVSKNHEVVFI